MRNVGTNYTFFAFFPNIKTINCKKSYTHFTLKGNF